MQDLKKIMDSNGLFVYASKNGDLDTVEGLEEAVKVSLFTDSRLEDSTVKDPFRRGGWVGDILNKEKRQLGGKTYLAERARVEQNTLNNAKEWARKSLDWLVRDGVCRNVIVNVSFYKQRDLTYNISIVGRDGAKYDYVYLWDKTYGFENTQNNNA
jgi:phage gp46-like protein